MHPKTFFSLIFRSKFRLLVSYKQSYKLLVSQNILILKKKKKSFNDSNAVNCSGIGKNKNHHG